ncbi:Anti-sigma regulatory factor (Ser/Thr protein kinase) [Streptomyces sp. 3213]|uniref:ATP-binding protein n=1 Tax=Streptomyces sp. 3213.3 TaxID=1855348 RepID=UPI0008948350|nr:ATP-binding protein [Streptomyces sp. 3213.3]SEE98257.1 Anti-sigma regulatory factor (Ser/Thr protein kinase) [Streptomyces sp. 3213] [Streptomyces sp. 3213.3]
MRTHRRTHRRSVRVEYLLPDEAAAAGQARKLTSEFLARSRSRMARVDEEQIDDATLIVSELVANATEHGRGECRLRLQLSDERVTVEVYDGSPTPPRVRPLTAEGESGRGLAMVRCLAHRLDVTPLTGGGKRVRAILAI